MVESKDLKSSEKENPPEITLYPPEGKNYQRIHLCEFLSELFISNENSAEKVTNSPEIKEENE